MAYAHEHIIDSNKKLYITWTVETMTTARQAAIKYAIWYIVAASDGTEITANWYLPWDFTFENSLAATSTNPEDHYIHASGTVDLENLVYYDANVLFGSDNPFGDSLVAQLAQGVTTELLYIPADNFVRTTYNVSFDGSWSDINGQPVYTQSGQFDATYDGTGSDYPDPGLTDVSETPIMVDYPKLLLPGTREFQVRVYVPSWCNGYRFTVTTLVWKTMDGTSNMYDAPGGAHGGILSSGYHTITVSYTDEELAEFEAYYPTASKQSRPMYYKLYYAPTSGTMPNGYYFDNAYFGQDECVYGIPDDFEITLNPTVVDINPETLAVTKNENVVVKYKSVMSYNFNATNNYNLDMSALSESYVTNESQSVMSLTGTGMFESPESGTFVFDFTYQVGTWSMNKIKTVNLTFIPYFNPTLEMSITSNNVDTFYVHLSGSCYNGNFGPSAIYPAPQDLSIRYRETVNIEPDAWSEWLPVTHSYNSAQWTYTGDITVSGLNYKNSYDFEARIIDPLQTVTVLISLQAPSIFDWGENDFNFNVPVNIEGDFNVNGKITSTLPGDYEVGEWTPVSNTSLTTVAFGHYVRIKNMCTITWYHQGTATSNPAFTDDYMTFAGLPYPPDANYYWAAGGGTCSNYQTTSTLKCFTGWCIQGEKIYGRTDGTGSAVHTPGYIYGGQYGTTVRASGTITYKIDDSALEVS